MIENDTVAILGCGTMGAGIAQVAATHGWTVLLKDINEEIVRGAIEEITKRLGRLVEKGRMTAEENDGATSRLSIATSPQNLAKCDLILEVVVENMDIKASVLEEIIPHLKPDCIIATNTSSLSVTNLGNRINQPHRTVGMHFFNPAPFMKLVEVIPGKQTDPTVTNQIVEVAKSWDKIVVRAADITGFIVNHIARPYYLEAFRILEDAYATPIEIDNAMKSVGRFRMGPFELTDLIGHDINTETSRQVYLALDRPPLLKPSKLQEKLVADGHLGRKTNRGVYDYSKDPKIPVPAINITKQNLTITPELKQALDNFIAKAVETPASDLDNYIVARILIALITQAHAAHSRGIATKNDIDTALRFGVNYPDGPFHWAEKIGEENIARLRDLITPNP